MAAVSPRKSRHLHACLLHSFTHLTSLLFVSFNTLHRKVILCYHLPLTTFKFLTAKFFPFLLWFTHYLHIAYCFYCCLPQQIFKWHLLRYTITEWLWVYHNWTPPRSYHWSYLSAQCPKTCKCYSLALATAPIQWCGCCYERWYIWAPFKRLILCQLTDCDH